MSHSHIPVKHLLKQVEIYRRQGRRPGGVPAWLSEFIDRAADLFEPILDDGRVGYDCQPADDRWVVGMYLGSTEIVGGRDDGRLRHTDFQLDVLRLTELFDSVETLYWRAFPGLPESEGLPASSFVTVEGRVGENPVRLHLYSVPPGEAGPGFRMYPDGRCRPV